MILASSIRIEGFRTGHVQGIAIDRDRKYMYISFTTCLVKADLSGRVLGSVRGLAGHLGCIAYNEEDGRVYGSLEYKHDIIGSSILKRIDNAVEVRDGFYIAIFDVEKIDRMDLDAERDGIMTAVYLQQVMEDYQAPGHRYGCSGIDGTTFAPLPGSRDPKKYLYVAYGIYGDVDRSDNDDQVILRYDITDWKNFERPLLQTAMHTSGPAAPDDIYFVRTGNTRYGIQNLEYDKPTNCLFAAVYCGSKPQFPNYPMYFISLDGQIPCLAPMGERHEASGIRGSRFPYGATGMISLDDGYFYFSRDYETDRGFGTDIGLYRFDPDTGFREITV